jgi:hypothetical protein
MSGIVQTVRNKQQRRHEKVDENTKFDYYYGIEADQFSFYRVPRLLIKDERFKGLSSDAKLLYGLMLDRMSLSMKNGWLDEENRAYIIYTVTSDRASSHTGVGIAAKPLEPLILNQQPGDTIKRELVCFNSIVVIKFCILVHFFMPPLLLISHCLNYSTHPIADR